MTIKIKATNIDLTDDIRNYVNKKIQKIEEIIGDDPTLLIEVEVGRTTAHHQNGDIFRAEINLNIRNKQYRSEAEKDTLYSAIDEAQEEILQIETKEKSKKISIIRRGGRTLKDLIKKFYK